MLALYDQPPTIKLDLSKAKNGRQVGVWHTPDYFVLLADWIGWEEWKTAAVLELLVVTPLMDPTVVPVRGAGDIVVPELDSRRRSASRSPMRAAITRSSSSRTTEPPARYGFSPELLMQPHPADRLAYFAAKVVAHPRLMDAHRAVHDALRQPTPPSLIVLYGPTGVGKTTLRLRLEQPLIRKRCRHWRRTRRASRSSQSKRSRPSRPRSIGRTTTPTPW